MSTKFRVISETIVRSKINKILSEIMGKKDDDDFESSPKERALSFEKILNSYSEKGLEFVCISSHGYVFKTSTKE